jgi:hypothetical protein
LEFYATAPLLYTGFTVSGIFSLNANFHKLKIAGVFKATRMEIGFGVKETDPFPKKNEKVGDNKKCKN